MLIIIFSILLKKKNHVSQRDSKTQMMKKNLLSLNHNKSLKTTANLTFILYKTNKNLHFFKIFSTIELIKDDELPY